MRLDEAKNIAKSLYDANKAIRDQRVAYDKMYNLVWDLPQKLKNLDWIQKRIIKLPYDSVEAGKRAYATMEPNFNFVMPSMKPETIERYNNIENLMRWHFMKASKRRSPIVATALEYAMLYGEVLMQPIHVDAKLQLMGNVSENKRRGLKKYGDFIIPVHNPQNAVVRYTDDGPDAVVLAKVQTLAEFVAFWGDKAAPIEAQYAKNKDRADNQYVVSYDYTDYDNRVVWANLQASRTFDPANIDGIKIINTPHGLPFFPWAAASTSDRQGILYPLHQTKAWELANLSETLMYSESIAYAASPRLKKTGPGDITVDYGDPGRTVDVPLGTQLDEMEPPALDQNLAALTDRTRADMQLVPDIVLSGDAPSGSAFASINQLMQSGLQTYAPYREVVERVLEDVGCLMLEWAQHMKKPLKAPVRGRKRLNGKQSFGGEFVLKPTEYEASEIEIMVELKPDMPVDRMSQIQAAAQGRQFLGWTKDYANEQLGENDPQELNDRLALEALEDAEIANQVEMVRAEGSLRTQAVTAGLQSLVALAQDPMGMQMLQVLQQQLAAAAQAPAAPNGGMGSPPSPANGMAMGEMSSDPSMGQVPPAMANPGVGSPPQSTMMDASGTQV